MRNDPPAAQSSSVDRGASNTGGGASSGEPANKGIVKGICAFVNMGLMVFMAATAALAIYESNNIDDTGVVFVGIYMMIFAFVEFTYEVSQLLPFEALENLFKRNFGFLFGTVGKSIFTIFMGILCFGLTVNKKMALGCGVVVTAWGFLQILIYMKVRKSAKERKQKIVSIVFITFIPK